MANANTATTSSTDEPSLMTVSIAAQSCSKFGVSACSPNATMIFSNGAVASSSSKAEMAAIGAAAHRVARTAVHSVHWRAQLHHEVRYHPRHQVAVEIAPPG